VDLQLSQPPHGTLERAPTTALRPQTRDIDAANEQWDGFWCVQDDRYYARCTRSDGIVEWYAIRDAVSDTVVQHGARVLPYRRPLATIVFVSRRDASPAFGGVSRRRSARSRRGDRR
jgi:hypothetical protein